jgi:hypothetical protein
MMDIGAKISKQLQSQLQSENSCSRGAVKKQLLLLLLLLLPTADCHFFNADNRTEAVFVFRFRVSRRRMPRTAPAASMKKATVFSSLQYNEIVLEMIRPVE